jgi:hypothetical protein
MKKRKELEDVLMEKFSDLELESSIGSWEKLSKKMDQQPGKAVNHSFLLVACLIAVIITAGIFIIKSGPGEKQGVVVTKKLENKKEDHKVSEWEKQVKETAPSYKTPLPEKDQRTTVQAHLEKNPEILVRTEERKQEYTLPDSSRVFINKYSQINVTSFKESNRTLSLDGEAFFEVKNKKGTPFRITCGRTYIEVIGTSFNVRKYTEDSIEVFVEEGKVKFGLVDNVSSFVFLLPGERGVFDNKNIKKSVNTDLNYLVWKTGLLRFNKTKVSDALRTMQAYFNVKINVSEPTILNCHLSGKFKNPDLKTIFAFLGKTLEIEYTKEGEEYFLKGKGCK